MTKKELRAEIEKLQKAYGLRYYGGINSMKKAELESFLDDIKYAHSLKCNTEAETVEVKAENTENTVETKAENTENTVETKVENTENTVEVEKNDNNVENMNFTEKNKNILFNCIWGAFRYFSNMGRREVGDYEFGQLVSDMYQTMCGEIETDSEWDEYWDIEESMVTHICEDMGCKQINKNHPNEDGYDTIIL